MKNFKLKNIDPGSTDGFRKSQKQHAVHKTEELLLEMNQLLALMYAENRHSLLIILQGIDASGKDGTVHHIFSGANPQGVQVHSFKKPSEEELKHDFLWRCHRAAPESGSVAIFNRSYYEDVTTLKVHPELLKFQHLPKSVQDGKDLFSDRFEQIHDFEKMLVKNGTEILKFFLHISKPEQKIRLQARLKDPTKHWKFSVDDLKERKHWDKYQAAYQDMLVQSSSSHAPWTVIPADQKWYRNYLISKEIVGKLKGLKMRYPNINKSTAD